VNEGRAEALQYLSETISCSGPDYEVRQQASFCGLLELGQDELELAIRSCSADRPFKGVCVYNSDGNPNTAFVRQILSHWCALRDPEGGQPHRRYFRDRDSGRWSEFCLLADQYDGPREDAIRAIEGIAGPNKVSLSQLQFLARVRPGSRLLLEHCERFLAFARPDVDVSAGSDAITAAEILGRYFSGSDTLLSDILASCGGERFCQKHLLAMCEAFPNHDVLASEYSELVSGRRGWMSPEFRIRLTCRCGTTAEVYALIERCLVPRRANTGGWRGVVVNPIVRRLSSDDELFGLLLGDLGKALTTSRRASFPRLLTLSRGLSGEVREWCHTELVAQLSQRRPPDVGWDIVNASVRPIAHALMEALGGSQGGESEVTIQD
jgi:hypothetical protein